MILSEEFKKKLQDKIVKILKEEYEDEREPKKEREDDPIDFAMLDIPTVRKPTSKVRNGTDLRDRIVQVMPSYMKYISNTQDREGKNATAKLVGVLPHTNVSVILDIYIKATWEEIKIKMNVNKLTIMNATLYRYEPEESIVRKVRSYFNQYTKTVIPKKTRTK